MFSIGIDRTAAPRRRKRRIAGGRTTFAGLTARPGEPDATNFRVRGSPRRHAPSASARGILGATVVGIFRACATDGVRAGPISPALPEAPARARLVVVGPVGSIATHTPMYSIHGGSWRRLGSQDRPGRRGPAVLVRWSTDELYTGVKGPTRSRASRPAARSGGAAWRSWHALDPFSTSSHRAHLRTSHRSSLPLAPSSASAPAKLEKRNRGSAGSPSARPARQNRNPVTSIPPSSCGATAMLNRRSAVRSSH